MNALRVEQDADLSALSTFGLPARAHELVHLDSIDQLPNLPPSNAPLLILGGGSNTVFLADWPGRILRMACKGIEVERINAESSRVRVAAGEDWHRLVRWCLDHNLYGLENLIMIPGSVGAAPMQNIGAYGVELADVLESVGAWDWTRREFVRLSHSDCGLGYRNSRFKSADRGRFLITEVTLKLRHDFRPNHGYASLADELSRHRLENPGPRQLAAAVMRLRRHRLPDPARLANAGSFFSNPVVDGTSASSLLEDHPRLPHWPMADGRIKLAAGWLIERLGFRGYRIGDAGVYANHALVLVNHGQATAEQLGHLIEKIRVAVATEYGLNLETEPMLVDDQGT